MFGTAVIRANGFVILVYSFRILFCWHVLSFVED